MPYNPNFGTGAVDWSNYVSANQATTDRDRQQVKDYLANEDTKARGAAQNAFQGIGYDTAQGQNGPGTGGFAPTSGKWHFGNQAPPTPDAAGNMPQSPSAQGVTDYNTLYSDLATNQGALETPEGYGEVANRAKAGYDPTAKDEKGNPKAPDMKGQQGFNSFDTALEGQNAKGLYQGLDSLDSYAKSFKAPPPAPGATSAAVPGETYSGPYPSNAGSDDSGTRGGYGGITGGTPTSTTPDPTTGIDTGTYGQPYDPNDPNDPRNKNQNYGGGG